MWCEHRALFAACLGGLERDPMVEQMRDIPQHAQGISCYDHSLYVAYVAFTLCRLCHCDYRAAARGGMLHDLYLQHWEETDVGTLERLWLHPQLALENARAFDLCAKEEDIIVKHMWPLTHALPRYKESFLVSLADKLCATVEMLHLARPLRMQSTLRRLHNAAYAPAWCV